MTKNINGDIYSDVITRANDNVMPSSSRGGFVPEFVVIHHMATTSFEGGMATWYGYNGGGTSANYAVSDTEIVGCVGENYSAWHAGGTGAYDIPNIPNINARSIGIEHVNSTGAPSWQVSDATIRNSAKLVADICKRYNIPITRDRIKRHGEITKTQCCGGLDIDKLVKCAQEIANGKQSNENGFDAQSAENTTKKETKDNFTEEIEMYLIECTDTKRYYISNGVDIRYVKTIRMLSNYKNQFGKLNLRVDKMYQSELDAEFGKNATDPKRDISK